MRRVTATFLLGSLVAGAALSDPAAPVSRAMATAELLATADAAAGRTGKDARKVLAQSVVALERIGAMAQDGEENVLPAWRTQAGPAAAGPVYRGRVLGPAYRRGWLEPGAELTLDQLFLGGRAATVAVAATPSQPLRLSVHGAEDVAHCDGTARDCRWTPIFTDRYTIRIRNAGVVRARYYLVFD